MIFNKKQGVLMANTTERIGINHVGEIDSFNWVSSFNDFKAKFKVD